jgi:hypothetical protein
MLRISIFKSIPYVGRNQIILSSTDNCVIPWWGYKMGRKCETMVAPTRHHVPKDPFKVLSKGHC